jgi:hypothetical protein
MTQVIYMVIPLLALQYLEDSPGLAALDSAHLINLLRKAADCLPISHVLIGWHLPPTVLEALRIEAEQLGLHFLRWQPVLTSDRSFFVPPSWYTEGLTGRKLPGHQGQPEFTFFCPNHPDARRFVLSHVQSIVSQVIYHGIFLDRLRFPSPSLDPLGDLACFCEHCQRRAADQGLDLAEIRQLILQQSFTEQGAISLVRTLLSAQPDLSDTALSHALQRLLAFRQACISDFLAQVISLLEAAHMEIGLDCFSPCLARMVGQDLQALASHVDWVKIMTYAHTNAPAGLPYELSGLVRFLTQRTSLDEEQAMSMIAECISLPLPGRQSFQCDGLSPVALEREVRRGVQITSAPILAGVELVDVPGVTHLHPAQIRQDLAAIKRANPAGLAISWDLLIIPLHWLDLVAQVYFGRP